jgi:hypothetical protein
LRLPRSMHPTRSRKTPTIERAQRRGPSRSSAKLLNGSDPLDYVWKRYAQTPERAGDEPPKWLPGIAAGELHGQPSLCTQPWRLCSGDKALPFGEARGGTNQRELPTLIGVGEQRIDKPGAREGVAPRDRDMELLASSVALRNIRYRRSKISRGSGIRERHPVSQPATVC